MIETKAEAEQIASRYRDMLPEPQWLLRIWENLGWHIMWTQGAVQLYYEPDGGKFWAMVGTPGSAGGHMDLRPDSKHFSDPLKAVRVAAQRAQVAYCEKWLPIIASVETILLEFS